MKFIVLDDFPFWTTYVLGVLVLCAFLFALTMLIRSLLVPNGTAYRSSSRSGRSARPWFFVIAGAAALWFLGSSMYLRFHAIGITPLGVEIVYFWPRPAVSVAMNDLATVKLSRAFRSCGHLEVATEHELFLSVNFRTCKGAEEVLQRIPSGKVSVTANPRQRGDGGARR